MGTDDFDQQVVKCCSHFRERIKLIHDNAYRFNGPDGPDMEMSPLKAGSNRTPKVQCLRASMHVPYTSMHEDLNSVER